MAERDEYAEFEGQHDWIEKTGRGGWYPDGSFAPDYDFWHEPSGSITRTIRQLVYLRRNYRLTPRQAALEVASRGFGLAFPNRESWLDLAAPHQWPLAMASTSAEEAVKDAGHGVNLPTRMGADDQSPPVDQDSARAILAERIEDVTE